MTATWPFAAFASMPPVRIERARGAYLYDAAGHEILDAAGGAIAVNIGHGRANSTPGWNVSWCPGTSTR